MKKILYIEANRDGTIGGSYYSLLYLIQGLDRAKYEPHVLFYQDHVLIPEFRRATPFVYVKNWKTAAGRRVVRMVDAIWWPYDFWMDVVRPQPQIGRFLDPIKPDLVHFNNSYAVMHEWMLACRLRNIKIISHDRGTRAPCSLRTRLFVRLLDATISVSESCKSQLVRQRLPVKRIRRVYNGLDVERMDAMVRGADTTRLLRELNPTGSRPLVGIVANIDRWKGQIVVLRAVKKLKATYPHIQCLIVGQTVRGAEPYELELKRFVSDQGLENNVVFTGFRKNTPEIMSLMDVLVHASIEPEPFSRVILEGMALSKPIVATDAGGCPEQIRHGETGLLVPTGDAEKMADAINWYVRDPNRAGAIGEAARRRLESEFSIRNMVDGVERVYEDVFSA
jgi:glycosyltransferase involved in cell wall biosynthesis